MFYYLWKKNVLRKFSYLRDEIIKRKSITEKLSDDQIKNKFEKIEDFFKKIPSKKKRAELLNDYLVEIFSITREVVHRKIGLLMFPTQVFGGIVLHNSNIAQMNTGEGKTMTAFLPICLNSLVGRSIFVVTVNEYLAKRDWELAKPVLDFFKISSGVNLSSLTKEEKKNLYKESRVIYTTGSELGFDYLRNNLINDLEDRYSRDHFYAIIDEVDSLLLDEGMNPLIISQRTMGESVINPIEYKIATRIANFLKEKIDYHLDENEKNIWLKREGIKKCEKILSLNNLFDFEHQKYNFLVSNALKSKHFYKKNIDYIVDNENNRIVIIDSLTGRLVPSRVYGAGIHQAIESKEDLKVSFKSRTVATITYQNFFRLFDKLCGMTGTAKSEEEEFRKVYGMEVIAIPPYKKMIRIDKDDLIFWDKKSKYDYIVKLIKKNYEGKKRPILIGSPSVEVSERLSALLLEKDIFHYKLNAINHKQEAEIISKAGQVGSITISTNMAGRGTDIVLEEKSKEIGGLLVIGIERNINRRIDDQLKGRCGRQGDPGESRFFVSLEDDLIKNFFLKKEERFGYFLTKEMFKEPLSGKMFNYLISEPQESLKMIQSSSRQEVLNYDLLISRQRIIIYDYRDKILENNFFNKEEFKKKRINCIREIDIFWSDYLESLSKIRLLSAVKVYLPQEPQESFFKETSELFKHGLRTIKKKIEIIKKRDE